MTQLVDDLYNALRKDDVEIFRTLLHKQGWPSNSKWSDHDLLVEAIKFGRQNVANFLLDLNCRVVKPGQFCTLVHVALTYSDWDGLVMKLLSLGATVSNVNAQGDTAVHVSFKRKADDELIDQLLSMYILESIENVKDSDGLSILHIACSRSRLNVVEALTFRYSIIVASHEDVNAQAQSNYATGYSLYTPLHFAVKNGRKEIINFLLPRFNLDVYKADANASTPLHLALERGDIEILDYLLAYDKVHEDSVNIMGFTHFMAACAGSNTSIVSEYLRLTQHRPWITTSSMINNKVVEFGSSPYRGYSALHFAAEFGRLDTVQLLLAHGASCFVVSAENLTPLVVALKRGHEDVQRLLWRQYKAYRQAIYEAMDLSNRKSSSNGQSKGQMEVKSQVKASSTPPPGFYLTKIPMSPKRGLIENKKRFERDSWRT